MYKSLLTALMLTASLAVGQVMDFDGVDQYVGTADTPFAFERTHPSSVSVWVKTSAAENQGLVCKYDDVANKGWFVYAVDLGATATALVQLQYNAGAYKYVYGDGNIADGAWHHIVATYDGSITLGGLKIYVDGLEDRGTTGESGALTSILNNEQVRLGVRDPDDGSPRWLNGSLDDSRVYGFELTSNQIARLTLDTCEMYDPTLITNSTLHSAASTWDTSYGNTNLVMYARGDMTGVGNGNAVTSAWSDTKGHTLTPYNSPTIEAAR